MEMTDRINKRLNDADLACHLLKEKRNAMHYRDIITEVRKLRNKTEDPTPTEQAQILTQINLDSRFVHIGKGLWSLKDFSASVSRSVISTDDDGIFIDGFDDEDILDADLPEETEDGKAEDDDDEDVAVEVIPSDDSDEDLIEVVPLDDILAEEERDEDEDEHPEDI